jgi:hypothetical protein
MHKLSSGNLGGVSAHNCRTMDVSSADPDGQIEILVDAGPDLGLAIARRIEEAGATVRSNSVRAFEVFCGASPRYFRDDPKNFGVYDEQKMRAFVAQARAWLERQYGKKNVVSLVLHLDEATPHLHAVVVPIDTTEKKAEQGKKTRGGDVRLNVQRYMGNRKILAQMQDNYYSYMGCLGLERGIRRSKSKHQDVKKRYRIMAELEQYLEMHGITDIIKTVEEAKKFYVKKLNDEMSSHIIKPGETIVGRLHGEPIHGKKTAFDMVYNDKDFRLIAFNEKVAEIFGGKMVKYTSDMPQARIVALQGPDLAKAMASGRSL